MKKFKVLAGSHISSLLGKRVVTKKGGTVTSDSDLCALFKGKFKYLGEVEEAVAAPEPTEPTPEPTEEGGEEEGGEEEGDDEGEEEGEEGEDDAEGEETPTVNELPEGYEDETPDFPEATEAGLIILRKRSWYSVFDPAKQTIVNTKGIRKDDVADFISEYTTESE